MIFDFGCRPAADLLAQVFPTVCGALACIAVVAGLAVLGRSVRKGITFQAADILCGWGLVAAGMTTVSVLFTQPLEITSFIVFGAMALAAIPVMRQKYFHAPFWIFALTAGLIVLAAITLAGISKADDFMHWVPNALYLWQNNGVPGKDLPVSTSLWPGYPYAIPFLTYLASHLAGGFLMEGGAMINFLMLLAFAAMLTEVKQPACAQQPFSLRHMAWLGIALLAVTFLNPNYDPNFTITSMGDAPTMIAVATLGLMYWNLIDAMTRQDRAAQQTLLLQIICVSTLLVLIKQVNIALLGLLTIAFFIASWKNNLLKQAGILMLPPLAVALLFRFLWQHHVTTEMADGQFGLKPFHEWRWDLLGPLLKGIGSEALRKSGSFALILMTGIYGTISLFRTPSRLRSFAIITAITSVGYLFFLIVCYLGAAFREDEVRRASAIYRFITHVGLLNISLIWIAAPDLWERWGAKATLSTLMVRVQGNAYACLLIVMLLPLSLLIDPHYLVPWPKSNICEMRNQARFIAQSLPDHARLAILAPEDDQIFSYIVNFNLSVQQPDDRRRAHMVWNVCQWNAATLPSRIKDVEASKEIDAIYMPKAEQTPIRLMGYANDTSSILLIRNGQEWKRVSP